MQLKEMAAVVKHGETVTFVAQSASVPNYGFALFLQSTVGNAGRFESIPLLTQKGNVRIFKTADAVISALDSIGVYQCDFRFKNK